MNFTHSMKCLSTLLGTALIAIPTVLAQSNFKDGHYQGHEESIKVKNGRILKCEGFAFGMDRGFRGSCVGFRFSQRSMNVIGAYSNDEQEPIFFCKSTKPTPARAFHCSENGWVRIKTLN